MFVHTPAHAQNIEDSVVTIAELIEKLIENAATPPIKPATTIKVNKLLI